MLRRVITVFSASLVTASLLLPAQTPSPSTRSFFVNVLDRNGNAVRDLAKDSFRVKLNGHLTPVLGADYGLAPRRIVVLLDTSGSMAGEKGNKKWQIAREAVANVSTITPTDVALAMVTFSDQVNTTFGFEQGRFVIAEWLKQGPSQREKLKGHTALFDATLEALKLLQPAQPGDAIYAITDGGDNHSHASASDTKRLLLTSGTRFFAFLFAEPVPTGEERLGVDSVMDIAGDSGGFVFGTSAHPLNLGASYSGADVTYDYDAGTREKIKLYTQALNIQVNGFYTVAIAAPVQPGKAGRVSLEIVDGAGKPRKDVSYTFQKLLPSLGK